mmetsp:Transcript_15262/g.38531  ORF Transcript_15262/g.38531 Transcript_15262/m.38531 type:complete len:427 (-) Transcript_15262:218-1498(-)
MGGLPLFLALVSPVLALIYRESGDVIIAFFKDLAAAPEDTLKMVWEHIAPNQEALIYYGVYMAFLLVGSIIVPGKMHKGTALNVKDKDGKETKEKHHLVYKCNGLQLYLILLAALYYFGYVQRYFDPTFMYTNFFPILTTVNLTALAASVYLYVKGLIQGADKGQVHPKTGNPIYDFVMGVQLNPAVPIPFYDLDFKFFWLRPSMMGWTVINFSLLVTHLEKNNGEVSMPMVLYQVFTFLYVFDYFFFEEYMTSTWDIIAENFGFMLVWGDLVFIPFVFSVQAWWLVDPSTDGYPSFEPWMVACIVFTFVVGYTIFRGANRQKHLYKQDNTALVWGKPPKKIGRLLCSGWWGMARHINYFGDIVLAVSYALPCAFMSVYPWAYPIYLTILLIFRERRDEAKCAAKYKDIWKQYTTAVPYRIVPYLY